MFDQLDRRHFVQYFFDCLVTADINIFLNILRIDLAVVSQHHPLLQAVEIIIFPIHHPFVDRISFKNMFLDKAWHHVRLDVLVSRAFIVNGDIDQHVPGAETETADPVQFAMFLNTAIQTGLGKFIFKSRHHFQAA